MEKVNRRSFIRQTIQMTGGLSLVTTGSRLSGSEASRVASANSISAVIPMPIQVVIDDVGWWSGEDGSKQQEPYRTGIARSHVPADYQAIVELGRSLDIRPQAAMVLCEWDKNNILRDLPTSTWMGRNWDNSAWVGPWYEEVADIIRNNPLHFELTIHGIGHEYWTGDTFTRAEWAERDGTMRPRVQVEKPLDFFEAILNQHDLGDFPRSFVPTAFCHGFGPTKGHDVSMAELLKRRGVRYINTPFSTMANSQAVTHGVFGFDAGVMTVDRGNDLLDWNIIGQAPSGSLENSTCGMHWPNLLHSDPSRNSEFVQRWVRFLKPYNDRLDTLLAPNSTDYQHQLVHQVCTKLSYTDAAVELDFTRTDSLPGTIGRKQLTLKIRSVSALRFTSRNIEITSETLRRTDEFIYTLQLVRKKDVNKALIRLSSPLDRE